MSTSDWERARFWRRWTCMRGMSQQAWSAATAAANSPHYSRIWTNATRQLAPSGSSWIIIRRTFPKETRTFLASRPHRFQYVLTPKHGSWLNIVETLFGKMDRTFLRHIRVQSWEELRQRILLGIAEINAAPVAHRWKKFDALTQPDQNTI